MSGSGTWLGNISKTVNLCNEIQDFYWKIFLEVPSSTPKVALQSEMGMMDMYLRINKQKCLLLNRLKEMDDNFFVKEVFNLAKENYWPGLHKDVKDICEEMNIKDMNIHSINKKELDAIFNLKQQHNIIKELEN